MKSIFSRFPEAAEFFQWGFDVSELDRLSCRQEEDFLLPGTYKLDLAKFVPGQRFTLASNERWRNSGIARLFSGVFVGEVKPESLFGVFLVSYGKKVANKYPEKGPSVIGGVLFHHNPIDVYASKFRSWFDVRDLNKVGELAMNLPNAPGVSIVSYRLAKRLSGYMIKGFKLEAK